MTINMKRGAFPPMGGRHRAVGWRRRLVMVRGFRWREGCFHDDGVSWAPAAPIPPPTPRELLQPGDPNDSVGGHALHVSWELSARYHPDSDRLRRQPSWRIALPFGLSWSGSSAGFAMRRLSRLFRRRLSRLKKAVKTDKRTGGIRRCHAADHDRQASNPAFRAIQVVVRNGPKRSRRDGLSPTSRDWRAKVRPRQS